jgi:hypothetical protein
VRTPGVIAFSWLSRDATTARLDPAQAARVIPSG